MLRLIAAAFLGVMVAQVLRDLADHLDPTRDRVAEAYDAGYRAGSRWR